MKSVRWFWIAWLLTAFGCGGSTTPTDAAPLDASDIVDRSLGDSMLGCPSDPTTLIGSACSEPGRMCGFCSEFSCVCDAARCNGTTWERPTVWAHTCDAIDVTDATGASDGADSIAVADVADGGDSGPTMCERNGGACVLGFPNTSPPGFRVTCPPGSALNDGSQSALNGGINIHDQYGDGCGYLSSSGGEAAPQACCYPVSDAGGDAATDDAMARGDAGLGALCATSSECANGFLCCYPCGIPGCMNQCTAVAPGGACPLLP